MTRYAGFKLLIVDDHAHNLFTLRTLIDAHMDVVVLEATSGQDAIDITLRHPDIDLIILDVQMPEMDGFQTASLLKLRKPHPRHPDHLPHRGLQVRGVPAAWLRRRARWTTCSSPSTTTC